MFAINDGQGLKPSAREVGISKTIGYRWLRDNYLVLPRGGSTMAEATAELGFRNGNGSIPRDRIPVGQ